MASLKKNIQIIHENIAKNISVVSAQARLKARDAAHDYMQNRSNQDLRILKNNDYEEAEAALAWLAKLDEVNKAVPELRDDEEIPAELVETSEHANNGSNA